MDYTVAYSSLEAEQGASQEVLRDPTHIQYAANSQLSVLPSQRNYTNPFKEFIFYELKVLSFKATNFNSDNRELTMCNLSFK